MRFIKPLIAALILAGSLASAQVNSYYVNAATGNDSNSAASVLNSGGAVAWKTIGHVDGNVTIGASGTVVHVAAGTYTAILTCANNGVSAVVCTNQGGASLSRRLTFQCDAPATFAMLGSTTQGCIIKQTPNTGVVQAAWSLEGVVGGSNFVDIIGFHFATNAASHAAIVGFCNDTGLSAGAQCPNINSVHAIGNLIEPMGQTLFNAANCNANGSSFGASIDLNDKHGFWVSDAQVIGNMIASYGNPGVCKFGYSIYANGKNQIIMNNIAWQAPIGLHAYDEGCGFVIANNDFFDMGDYGMIVWNTTDFPGDAIACNPKGLNSIVNNHVDNTGVGWTKLLSDSGSGMQLRLECDSTHPTLVSNNSMNGQTNTLPGGQPANFIGYQGAGPDSCVQIVNTITTETPSNTFVNYQNNGTGDYHPKATSLSVQGGTRNCVAGGANPCTPTTDFSGNIRPNPPSVGAFELPSISLLTLTPTSTPFGNVLINTSSTLPITLSNNNVGTVTISSAILAGVGLSVTPAHPCVGPLAANASCNFSATCSPAVAGAISGTLTFTHNASNSPSVETLSCTGTAPNGHVQIPIPPTGLNFGSQQVGTPSGSQPVTYQNIGTAPLTFSSIVANGDFSIVPGSNNCPVAPATLAVAGTCSLSLIFTPTIVGTRNGTLLFNSNDPLSPQTVALTGIGQQGVIPPTGIVFQQGVIGVN